MAMMEHTPDRFGLKRLTVENWLTIDPAWYGVVMSSSSPDHAEGWVFDLVRNDLNANVPPTIRGLFEVARGSLVYSVMFYPLLTLGTEQLFRVLEAALSLKCVQMDAPAKVRTFEKRIDWLAESGVLTAEQKSRWTGIRHLRNDASHPREQNIFGPAMALQIVELTLELVNALFAK
jgi:hypothetical protein